MAETKSSIAKRLGIAATIVSLTGGTVALWKQFKPEEKLPSVAGAWTIEVIVDGSSTGTYNGDTYQYEIAVHQDGANLSGSGKQTKYRGKKASGWPFEIVGGKVGAEQITISYKVINAQGGYTGSLRLTLEDDAVDHLHGKWTSSTADQTGPCTVVIR